MENPMEKQRRLMNIMKQIKKKIEKNMENPMEKKRKTNEHNEAN